MAMIRSSIGLYLRYSVMATVAVVVIPLLIVGGVGLSVRTGTPLIAAALVGAGLSLTAAVIGSLLWKRRPESMDLCFGELMLWSFFKRRRAEEKLESGAEVIGLDDGGRPLRRLHMSKEERLKVLHDLAAALETKDPYTHGHSTRVEDLAVKTATALELSEEEVEELRTAASLHDVGKIRVPNRILRKPDHLTIDEQLIVQDHSSVGAWMVAGATNGQVALSVRHHHERWDGHGYPDGLSGRDIPLFARIIAVADAYDAMTSTRPYRPGLSRNEALKEIEKQAGVQFDPEVVEAFMATVPRRVPLAGFVGLGLIERLLRKTAAWGARAGSGSVASGVVSVGAASVLIGSLFSPPTAFTQPTPGPDGTGAKVTGSSDSGRLSPQERRANGKSKAREEVSRKRAGADADGKGGAGEASGKRSKGDEGDKGDGTSVLSDRIQRGERNGNSPADVGTPPEGVDNNPPPGTDGNPQPPDPPDTGGGGDKENNAHEPPGDPRPEYGRDCPEEHPVQGTGPGTERHCG